MNSRLCRIVLIIVAACVATLPNETFAATEKIEAAGVYVIGNSTEVLT